MLELRHVTRHKIALTKDHSLRQCVRVLAVEACKKACDEGLALSSWYTLQLSLLLCFDAQVEDCITDSNLLIVRDQVASSMVESVKYRVVVAEQFPSVADYFKLVPYFNCLSG